MVMSYPEILVWKISLEEKLKDPKIHAPQRRDIEFILGVLKVILAQN